MNVVLALTRSGLVEIDDFGRELLATTEELHEALGHRGPVARCTDEDCTRRVELALTSAQTTSSLTKFCPVLREPCSCPPGPCLGIEREEPFLARR